MKNPFKSIRLFWRETADELKKASWPTKKSLRNSTIVVVFGMFLLGLYVSVVDFSLIQIVDFASNLVR